jgi:hypothetical protein
MATKASSGRKTSGTKATKRAPRSKAKKTVEVQKDINRDYKVLFEDYKKLSKELWSMRETKYVVGGLAAVSLLPLATGALSRIPRIKSFFSKNLEAIEDKIEEFKDQPDKGREKIFEEDARH